MSQTEEPIRQPRTVLTALYSILESHQFSSPAFTAPFLHPYAPISSSAFRKGKGRADPLLSDEETVHALRRVREALEGARLILGARDSPNRTRLARALKEVGGHETALVPLTSMDSMSSSAGASIPSPLVRQSPVQLLTGLAKRLGIQTFMEDSQFGLLKTSLALAGQRFVVDVDLETDPSPGEEQEDEDEPMTAARSATPLQTPGTAQLEGRGKVRLSKLNASYVAGSGSTVRSDWIAGVLREHLEAYLELWNTKVTGPLAEGDRARSLELLRKRLEIELKSLVELDELMGEGTIDTELDYFADLEMIATHLQRWTKQGITAPIEAGPSMLPRVQLLTRPSETTPLFAIRPAKRAEDIPSPFGDAEGAGSWLRGRWILEVLPNPSSTWPGLIVRRDWLGTSKTASGPMNGTTVEALLFGAGSSFPYTTAFVHSSPPWLAQHWSIATPCLVGFVVGRVGLSMPLAEVERLFAVLRNQIVLNELFIGVFSAKHVPHPDGLEDPDAEADLDLTRESTSFPITVRLTGGTIEAAFPLPHHPGGSESPTVILTFAPIATSSSGSFSVSWTAEGTMSDGQRTALDQATSITSLLDPPTGLVEVARRIDDALRQAMS